MCDNVLVPGPQPPHSTPSVPCCLHMFLKLSAMCECESASASASVYVIETNRLTFNLNSYTNNCMAWAWVRGLRFRRGVGSDCCRLPPIDCSSRIKPLTCPLNFIFHNIYAQSETRTLGTLVAELLVLVAGINFKLPTNIWFKTALYK